MPQKPEHGFIAVDQQADPNAWVGVLDKLSAEPFYTAYKQRVLEFLEPRDGACYLDLGAGAGDDARSIASSANCCVIAADRSLTMATVCHNRGRVPAVVCDASDLPFPAETFDGTRADRTFQQSWASEPGRAARRPTNSSRWKTPTVGSNCSARLCDPENFSTLSRSSSQSVQSSRIASLLTPDLP